MYNDYIIDQVPDKLFTCYFNIHEILLQSAILFLTPQLCKNVLIHIVRSKEHSHMTSANMGRGRGLSKVDVTQLSNLKVIRISLKENLKKINMNHQIEESTILSIFSYC